MQPWYRHWHFVSESTAESIYVASQIVQSRGLRPGTLITCANRVMSGHTCELIEVLQSD